MNIEARIKELQNIIEQSRDTVKINQYDFADSASAKAYRDYTDAVFKNRVGLIKSYRQDGASAPASELTYEILERRKEAVIRLAAAAEERYREKYPHLSAAEMFAQLCAPCPESTFDELDAQYHIELAAALWILDALRGSDQLDEALASLPQSREELDCVELPEITDAVHSDDLIRAMLYLIRYRNRDVQGFIESKAFFDGADAAQTTQDAAQSENRSRFDAVMRLIGADTVSKLQNELIRAVDALTDSCLAILDDLCKERETLTRQKINIIEGEIAKGRQTGSQEQGTLSLFNPDAVPTDETFFAPAYTVTSNDRNNGPVTEENLNRVQYQIESFCVNILQLTEGKKKELIDLLGDTLKEKLNKPVITDPFACCFAFLTLLDSNSDAVWLYNLPYIVLADACCDLPWAAARIIGSEEEPSAVTPAFYQAATEKPERYITPPSESVLSKVIVDHPFVHPYRNKISFSQLTYLMSGLVPPRGMPELSYIKSLLSDSGLSQGEIDILYEYFTLACCVSQRDENYVFIDEEEDDAQEDASGDDDAARELREAKRENKKLKAMINKLEHRLRESGEALSSANESLDEASAELAELRSMIREAEEHTEEYTISVTFPYTARKRAVVFGGHDSWAKAIKPLLPNVRFVEPSALPNTGLILNADVVWIQTNAMSHSNFYKIIDIVRRHGIDLRYFKYASAEKCAEQFALFDSEAESSEPTSE